MKLQHSFFTANTPAQGFWAKEVFGTARSLETFENNLQKIAFPKNENDLNGHKANTILGDGFEGLTEIVMRQFGYMPHIRVSDVTVMPPGKKGYDFKYLHSQDLTPGTIQSKYIGKGHAWNEMLKESETMKLERFQLTSWNDGVPVDSNDNLIVVTNAKDIDWFTSQVLLHEKVRCIGRSQLKALLNNNLGLWNYIRNVITENNPRIVF